MKYTFSTLFLVLCYISNAQSYSQLIADAKQHYSNGQYVESARLFDQAFSLENGNSGQYYDAACSWALTGDTIHAMDYLKKSMDAGWNNVKHLSTDADLTALHKLSGWQEILSHAKANQEVYEKDFDKPLKTQLEAIYVRDQTLRQLYQDAEGKFGRESEEMNYFWSLVGHEDSLNEVAVIAILESRGWPGKSLVGKTANMAVWLVIQHAELSIQEKYLPMLRESVLKGESSGSHLALLEDRILMRNNKPQTYGSQVVYDEETGLDKVYDIQDPEYVNQRRKEVGLEPLEIYLKHWNIEWKVEQKER